MAKLTLADVSNLLGNPTSAANRINSNNNLIEAALENTLSRDGSTPNQMLADFDLNHNDLLNGGNAQFENLVVGGSDIIELVERAEDAAEEAEQAAEDAEAARDEILSISAGFSPVVTYPFLVNLGETSVTIPGGYQVGKVSRLFLNGVRQNEFIASNGTTVIFPPITDIPYGDTTALIEVDVGVPTAGLDALDERYQLAGLYVSPEKYQGVGDGVSDDTTAIRRAAEFAMDNNQILDLGSKTWMVTKGTDPAYLIEGEIPVVKNESERLYIRGSGAKILFDGANYTEYATVFRGGSGAKIDLRGVDFDYKRLPFAQGVCLSKSASAARFTIDTSLGVPSFTTVMRINVYGPDDKTFIRNTLEQPTRRNFTFISGTTWEVDFSADVSRLSTISVGETAVLYHQVNGFGFIYNPDGSVHVDDCEINACAGFPISGTRMGDVYVGDNVRIRPPLDTNRIISSTSDGIHFNGVQGTCRIMPAVIDGTSDDGINVNMPFNFVYDSEPGAPYDDGKTFLMGVTVEHGGGPRVGEQIIFITQQGLMEGRIIEAVLTAPPASPGIPAIRLTTTLPAGTKGTQQLSPGELDYTRVGFARWLPRQPYIHPGILRRTVGGCVVRGENPIIRGNITRTNGPGLTVISGWGVYSEGPVPGYLDIDVNVIDCGRNIEFVTGAVIIYASVLDGSGPAPAGAIVGGHVRLNIQDCPVKAIHGTSWKGIKLSIFERNNNFNPWLAFAHPEACGYFVNCDDLTLDWNTSGPTDSIVHFESCPKVYPLVSNSRVFYSSAGGGLVKTTVNNLVVSEGGNSAGAGGRVGFRAAFGTWSDKEMSEVRGYLSNSQTGEQQGGLIMATRPTGAAGQNMTDRLLLNANGTLQFLTQPPAYVDDAAAAAGGHPVGVIYHNTTINGLRARRT